MPAGPARKPSKDPAGALRCNTSVVGFGTSILPITPSCGTTTDFLFVWPRSILAFTAWASNGVPSWNTTPLRKVSVSVFSSCENSHLVASPGENAPVTSSLSRESNTGIMNSPLEGAALVWGS